MIPVAKPDNNLPMPAIRRINGLDLARGLAVIGMFAAHLAPGKLPGNKLSAAMAIVDGRPSALFAVLAGVSLTIITYKSATLNQSRLKISLRALVLIALGLIATSWHTAIAVILTTLGVLFLLAIPVLRWSWQVLASVTAACFIGGAALGRFLETQVAGTVFAQVPILDTFWSYRYVVPAWFGYICAGILIGRLILNPVHSKQYFSWRFAALAFFSTAVVMGIGWVLGNDSWWGDTAPHSYTPIELLGNTLFAYGVIAASMQLAKKLPRLSLPLVAVGALPLTSYLSHLVIIAVVGNQLVWDKSWATFGAVTGAIVVACLAWYLVWGSGPLERILKFVSDLPVQRSRRNGEATPAKANAGSGVSSP